MGTHIRWCYCIAIKYLIKIFKEIFECFRSPYVGHVSEETSPSSIWRPALLSSNTAKEDSETSAQSLQFLSLDLNPKMVSNPYLARYKFWNDLNLVDS